MDMISMVVALTLMVLALIARIFTAGLIGATKSRIANVEKDKQQILNQLKSAQAQRKVAEKNKVNLEKKKTKLEGKKSRFKRELKELESDVDRQKQKSEAARGHLIKPTRLT